MKGIDRLAKRIPVFWGELSLWLGGAALLVGEQSEIMLLHVKEGMSASYAIVATLAPGIIIASILVFSISIFGTLPVRYVIRLILGLYRDFVGLDVLRRIDRLRCRDDFLEISEDIRSRISGGVAYASDDVLRMYISQTKKVADRLYERAGIYLFLGGIIAVSGILFGALRNEFIIGAYSSVDMRAFGLVTTFSVVLFVEVIAWFFLKQYKSTMDEYRYFDSIKRHREDLRMMLRLADERGEKIDFEKLILSGVFFSGVGASSEWRTNELISMRKIDANEPDILNRVADVLRAARKG